MEIDRRWQQLRRYTSDFRRGQEVSPCPWPVPQPSAKTLHFSAEDFDLPLKSALSLRLLSLNVAHGRRNAPIKPFLRRRTAKDNLTAIAETMNALTPDVVALQEADGPSTWSGNFDHVATLAQQTELRTHYRGDHNPFRFGRFQLASVTALLAKRPLLHPSSHRFDMCWRDTKGFVVATVQVPEWGGQEVDVVSVHLDFLNPAIRRKQISQMVDSLAPRQRPMIILGDLNCCWQKEPKSMRLLVDSLDLQTHQPESPAPTYPTWRPRRRLDWILATREIAYRGYHTVSAPVSDHLVLVADLQPKG